MKTIQTRLLVHLHLYYQDQWDYFAKKLSHIVDCEWDLVVTLSQANEQLTNKIITFKPNAKVIVVNNRGYDIWPFLQILNQTDLSAYDFILKLHTKRPNITFDYNPNYIWRDLLVDSLIGSKERFLKNLSFMKAGGGLCAAGRCFLTRDSLPEDTILFDQIKTKLHLLNNTRWFIAGTMFFIKSDCLQKLKNNLFTEQDFSSNSQSGNSGTLAHTLERVFVPLVLEQNYLINMIDLPCATTKDYWNYFRYKTLYRLGNKSIKNHYDFRRQQVFTRLYRSKYYSQVKKWESAYA